MLAGVHNSVAEIHLRLGHGDGRAELIAKLYQKISFVDSCFLGKKSLDEIAVDEKSWEDTCYPLLFYLFKSCNSNKP